MIVKPSTSTATIRKIGKRGEAEILDDGVSVTPCGAVTDSILARGRKKSAAL
jgi:hypothetical protein